MNTNYIYMISLIISTFLILIVYTYINKSKIKNQLTKIISINFGLVVLWNISLILQICFLDYINPIYFDYIAYIGICFLPISLLFTCIIFANTKIKFTKKYLLLFIIPILSLLILWTNDLHHLFYKVYSINFRETVFGSYFLIHTIYSYSCIAIGLIYLMRYIIKNSGFFSRQSLLIFIGTLISLLINIFATFGIFDLSIYVTPISFAIETIFISIAIFKFNFLKVAPIALQKIVDKISDAYVVVNEDNIVADFNKTFLDLFEVTSIDIRNKNIYDLISHYPDLNIDAEKLRSAFHETKSRNETVILEEYIDKIDKHFHIEIASILSKGNFLGILILLKDVTQHNIDIQTIKDNQDRLLEKERLASLGQMIGGIAHNLKTPIMSISGATQGISDLIDEYDSSIGDPEVTADDYHAIASDMREWIEKIRTHLSYMSNVITAIKGQAVNFSDQTSASFTINELINYVNILMKHELNNALINLNVQADIDTSLKVNGNINSLVQVINNIISNAIQAYQQQGKTNENIDFNIYKEKNNMIFKISDTAGGLPQKVQDKLFKEMITTKGKNGTGLGLFMSYSNIKAHFSGNLRYKTEEGKGTSFFIEIPA